MKNENHSAAVPKSKLTVTFADDPPPGYLACSILLGAVAAHCPDNLDRLGQHMAAMIPESERERFLAMANEKLKG